METITVEIKSNKAMKLLKELENLDIIKIHDPAVNQKRKDKSSKYRGTISSVTANKLLKHVQKTRNEWEERFPLK